MSEHSWLRWAVAAGVLVAGTVGYVSSAEAYTKTMSCASAAVLYEKINASLVYAPWDKLDTNSQGSTDKSSFAPSFSWSGTKTDFTFTFKASQKVQLSDKYYTKAGAELAVVFDGYSGCTNGTLSITAAGVLSGKYTFWSYGVLSVAGVWSARASSSYNSTYAYQYGKIGGSVGISGEADIWLASAEATGRVWNELEFRTYLSSGNSYLYWNGDVGVEAEVIILGKTVWSNQWSLVEWHTSKSLPST